MNQMQSELLHEWPNATVRRVFVSEMNNAVYLVTHLPSSEQLLIDAADDAPTLHRLLADGAADAGEVDPHLTTIVTTHAHWDHTRAIAALARSTGATVAIGAEDAKQLEVERGVRADRLLAHGDTVTAGELELAVIHLRGHTPGSMALATGAGFPEPRLLFTGDSLFPGGVGNTDHDPQRFASLIGDVTERIFARFDDSAVVYPGHGAATTLGAERPYLEEWRARGW